MKTTLIICIFALGGWWTQGNATTNEFQKPAVSDSLKIDPVCKMKVKASSSIKSTFNKQEYVFCNKTCKLKFDKNPEKYLK